MPNLGLLPLQGTLLALATQVTNGTSAKVSIPLCESYRFFLEVQTVSGTSPTLQVNLSSAADGGTNFQVFAQFVAVTTSGGGRQLTFRPYLQAGDTSTEGASALVGTGADQAAGAVTVNGPIDPASIKVRWIAGGTTPSFAFAVRWLGVPAGSST